MDLTLQTDSPEHKVDGNYGSPETSMSLARMAEALDALTEDGTVHTKLSTEQHRFLQAQNTNKLSLKHFRKLARCLFNCKQYEEAQKVLFRAEHFEAANTGAASLLSNNSMQNERIKISDLKRELAKKIKDGTPKRTPADVYVPVAPSISRHFSQRQLSVHSLSSTDTDDKSILDDELLQSMQVYDTMSSILLQKRQSSSRLAPLSEVKCIPVKTTVDMNHIDRLCYGSKSNLGYSHPRPAATSNEIKPAAVFPVPTPLMKGKMKRTEFPRYAREHSKYLKKTGKVSSVKTKFKRYVSSNESAHAKYVNKDKSEICNLVSVLGRDNDTILDSIKTQGMWDDIDSLEITGGEEEEETEAEGEGEGLQVITTAEPSAATEMGTESPGFLRKLLRRKSVAIQLLDKKIAEYQNPNDTRVRFPGLLS